ncbi:MAG TPA: hypothetical protein DDZ83_18065 [Nitrospinae bacterium]|nr:hypothetical protein [Nitrospinota bacterium]
MPKSDAEGGKDAFYVAATEAEAHLLLGDLGGAKKALQKASDSHGGDLAALASTRKQLGLICGTKNIGKEILEPVKPPGVIHFVGHMISPPNKPGRFQAGSEKEVAGEIDTYLSARNIGLGFGALACGADIFSPKRCWRGGRSFMSFSRSKKTNSKKFPSSAGDRDGCPGSIVASIMPNR